MDGKTGSQSNGTDLAAALTAAGGGGARGPAAAVDRVSIGTSPGVGGIGMGGNRAFEVTDPTSETAKEPSDGIVEQARVLTELARRIRTVFDANEQYRRKSGTDEYLDRMQRLATRKYTEREKALIAMQRAPDVYVGTLDVKRRSAVAVIMDIGSNPTLNGKPWTLEPTPLADVPGSVRKAAVGEAMLGLMELQELAARVHELKVAAGEAERGSLPQQVVTPERMEELVPLKLDEARRTEQEKARQACERMERIIHDDMVEGGFGAAYEECAEDLATYGTCVMRGPTPRMVRRNVGIEDSEGRRRRIESREEVRLCYEAVSPWDCFPSPGSKGVADGDIVVRVRFMPRELKSYSRMKGGATYRGWDGGRIDEILDAWPHGGLRERRASDPDREAMANEGDGSMDAPSYIEGLEYYGEARGSELLGIGMRRTTNGRRIVREEYYEIDAISIGDVVVFCRVIEPEIGRPLAKAGFYPTRESWWSEGPMAKAEDCQRIENAIWRSLCINMAQSAAPQMVGNVDLIDRSCGTDCTPGKFWQVHSPQFGMGGQTDPLKAITVPSNARELIDVQDRFRALEDDLTGVPSYTYGGGTSASLGRTASGLSMLTEASTRIMKRVVSNVDAMIRDVVMRTYSWEMLHGTDETAKIGDVSCNPSGVMGLVLVEQNYNRLREFLAQTGNQFDMQVVTLEGRAYIYREIAKMLNLNPDKLVASPEKLRENQMLADMRQQLAVRQQNANAVATEAGIGGGGSGEGGGAEEGGENPTNAMRSEQARMRRSAAEAATGADRYSGGVGGGAPGIGSGASGTIRQTITNPQERAAQGAASAATRAANGG